MILTLFIYLLACHVVCGILTHTKGGNWNPHPLWWKCRVLTTGPPGKFPHRTYFKKYLTLINSVVAVQLLSHVQLFATPLTAACQASLSFTISWGLLKLVSIESVMPSNLLILSSPSPPSFSLSSIRILSNEMALYFLWPKYRSFSIRISTSNEYSGLISFRMDWFDLLAVQGTLKSLLQHHSSKASVLWCSAFFMVQLSHPYMNTGKSVQSLSRV